MKTRIKQIFAAAIGAALPLGIAGLASAQSKPDPFYLPQQGQPFEGKVKTRIGSLEFDNQYPSRESMESILDSMDFHGATQAYLWGIPIASFANLQYYSDKVWKFRQGELVKYTNLDQKLGILTANATTPYIVATVNLSETGPFVIDLPAGAIAGMVDDFWQRPVTDLGLPGPDLGWNGNDHPWGRFHLSRIVRRQRGGLVGGRQVLHAAHPSESPGSTVLVHCRLQLGYPDAN